MNGTKFDARMEELLTEEKEQPRLTWWLSFASEEGFLGVVIVDNCPDLIHARLTMTLNGLKSPGGEVMGFGFDPACGPPDQVAVMAKLPRLTLLSKADLESAGLDITNDT